MLICSIGFKTCQSLGFFNMLQFFDKIVQVVTIHDGLNVEGTLIDAVVGDARSSWVATG